MQAILHCSGGFMIIKIVKLLILACCIMLLSGCEITLPYAIEFTIIEAAKIEGERFHADMINKTYGEDFFVTGQNEENYTMNASQVKNDVISVSENYPQIQLSSSVMTTFWAKIININETQKEPNFVVNLTMFDSYQKVDDDVFMVKNNATFGRYLLKDALNYQWLQGYINFLNIYNQTNNKDILYKISLSILTDLVDDKNDTKNKVKKVSFHYKYNINIINSKTGETYLSKNLKYDDNTTITTDSIAYYPYSDYITPIVEKNREVIEKEVFTDELYTH